jgi:hypothetical protein
MNSVDGLSGHRHPVPSTKEAITSMFRAKPAAGGGAAAEAAEVIVGAFEPTQAWNVKQNADLKKSERICGVCFFMTLCPR